MPVFQHLPRARRVYLRSGETEIELGKNGDDFEGDFLPTGETVDVSAELEGVSFFEPARKQLIQYQVR